MSTLLQLCRQRALPNHCYRGEPGLHPDNFLTQSSQQHRTHGSLLVRDYSALHVSDLNLWTTEVVPSTEQVSAK